MGVLDNIRGRDTSQLNAAVHRSEPGEVAVDEKSPDQAQDTSASDSDTLSLEARNEKEIRLHPDQITANAEIGIQKAEAVTLIWGKKTVYAVYAWWVEIFFLLTWKYTNSSQDLDLLLHAGFPVSRRQQLAVHCVFRFCFSPRRIDRQHFSQRHRWCS